MSGLDDVLIGAFADIRELQRNMSKVLTIGTIASIDLETSTIKAKIKTQSDGTPLLTPSIKWLIPRLSNGGFIWANPKVNDRVVIVSLTGNLNAAYAIPMICQNDNRPTDYANDKKTQIVFDATKSIIVDENTMVIKNDKSTITMEDDSMELKLDSIFDAKVTLNGTGVTINVGLSTVVVDNTGVSITSTGFLWNGLQVVAVPL